MAFSRSACSHALGFRTGKATAHFSEVGRITGRSTNSEALRLPEGQQDHGCVTKAPAVVLGRLNKALDLSLGQLLARPIRHVLETVGEGKRVVIGESFRTQPPDGRPSSCRTRKCSCC